MLVNLPAWYLMPTMTFPGNYTSLPAISAFITQFAREAGFDEHDVYAVELAVDEACTNIIEHGYNSEPGEITCTCQSTEDSIKIVLKDRGKSFDPEKVPQPDPTLPLEEVSARGAGLFLMKKMMDEVHFDFDPANGNVLTMVKHKSE